MKKYMLIIPIGILLCGFFKINTTNLFYKDLGTFIDARDKQEYKMVQIGTQTWMAENLNYDISNSWCYNDSADYCEKYGRLYTWESATKACPKGWSLPSDKEWEILSKYISKQVGTLKKAPGDWEIVNWEGMAPYLKSKSGWYLNANGTDNFGFNGKPGGVKNARDGSFTSVGESGYWWSSTAGKEKFAYRRDLYYSTPNFGNYQVKKELGYCVRCLKD